MTNLLDRAMRAAQSLPPHTQDEVARLVLGIAGEDLAPVPLTPEEEASLRDSLAQADRGEYASDEEVRAVWAKHGL